MALLQQDKAHSDRDRRFAGSQAIVGLLEGKTQPAGGLQHAPRVDSFTAARLLSTRSTVATPTRASRAMSARVILVAIFFKVIVAMNERNDRNYHG
ncbi:Uncharacterised protein [Klebsiella pneumoniae]|uniref:Uncharacterized protein n=1 Tax=Klebsiella pneumoniae TaxID=573 RepID=A0A378B7P6_KLEPN|nr:Uncharacterised protein [Klebsiella pneumoniae]